MTPDYIIIDFDSTFITEESLDELAKYKLRDQPDSQTMLNKIKSLTNAGMNGDIPFKQSLDERMEVLNLNRSDINSVSKILSECVTPSFTKNKSFEDPIDGRLSFEIDTSKMFIPEKFTNTKTFERYET